MGDVELFVQEEVVANAEVAEGNMTTGFKLEGSSLNYLEALDIHHCDIECGAQNICVFICVKRICGMWIYHNVRCCTLRIIRADLVL